MLASLALVAAVVAPAKSSNAFLTDFAGSWRCSAKGEQPSLWRIGRVPGSRWVRVDWGIRPDGLPSGSAFVGYIPARGTWVYRDFHGGGSYANMHGTRASDGTWSWSGPFYPYSAARGSAPLAGRITWKRSDARHVVRTFASLERGTLVPHGGDVCTAQ